MPDAALKDNPRSFVMLGISVDKLPKPAADFVAEKKFDAIAAVARGAKVAFEGLFLTADTATRVARIGTRSNDASDADAAIARQQETHDLGALDWDRVDASGTPADTLARARAAID